MITLDAVRLIVEAEIHPQAVVFKSRPQRVSGATIKAVLLTIAYFEGDRISLQAIADHAGTSIGTVHRSIHSLRRMGLVSTDDVPERRGKRFRVHLHKLAAMKCRTPLLHLGTPRPRLKAVPA